MVSTIRRQVSRTCGAEHLRGSSPPQASISFWQSGGCLNRLKIAHLNFHLLGSANPAQAVVDGIGDTICGNCRARVLRGPRSTITQPLASWGASEGERELGCRWRPLIWILVEEWGGGQVMSTRDRKSQKAVLRHSRTHCSGH